MIQIEVPFDVFSELSQFLSDEEYPIGFTAAVERAIRLWCREAHIHPDEHLANGDSPPATTLGEKQLLKAMAILHRLEAKLQERGIKADVPTVLERLIDQGLPAMSLQDMPEVPTSPPLPRLPVKQISSQSPQRPRQPSMSSSHKQLRVVFADGTAIQEPKVASTMALVIEKIGVETVASLGMTMYGYPLIADEPIATDKYSGWQPLATGQFVFTHSNTQTKKKQLEEMFQRLSIPATVTLVDA